MIKKISTLCAVLASLGFPAPGGAAQTLIWSPDLVHSRAEFTVSHLVVSKVWGHIPIQAMSIATPPGSVIPSAIDATLNVAREDTDNHDRDADLRSATYFDVEQYPTMAFRSTKIVAKGPDDFDVTGLLTIKNVSKPVEFSAHVEGKVPDEGGGTRVGYSGELHVDRRDFGIVDTRLSAVGVLVVGYDVAIRLTVEATSQDPSVRVK
jgi:polyisoprenoid-binding protein YceI